MSIRHAVPADVDTLADIEAASYPPAEGASRQSIAGRVAVYPDHFWLLEEDGGVKAFVNGLVTDQPDLTDAMYDDPHLHTPEGSWQMIFSVVTAPAHRREGCASRVLRQALCRRKGRWPQGRRAHLQGEAHRLLRPVRLRGRGRVRLHPRRRRLASDAPDLLNLFLFRSRCAGGGSLFCQKCN